MNSDAITRRLDWLARVIRGEADPREDDFPIRFQPPNQDELARLRERRDLAERHAR